jgi:hypothetical protein
MVNPRNEPDAPPSTGRKSQMRSGWFLLRAPAIVIIAPIAVLSHRRGPAWAAA